MEIKKKSLLSKFVLYFIQGFVVALLAFTIPKVKINPNDILTLSIGSSLTLFVLDLWVKKLNL